MAIIPIIRFERHSVPAKLSIFANPIDLSPLDDAGDRVAWFGEAQWATAAAGARVQPRLRGGWVHVMIRMLLLFRTCAAMAVAIAPAVVPADEVRYFTENNTLFRETRRFVERPVTEAQASGLSPQSQPVSAAGAKQQYYRARWVQVVEYRYEPIWGTYCSATCQPVLIPRWVPYTRWALQHEPAPVTVQTRPVGLASHSAAFWPGNRSRYVIEEVVERVPIAKLAGPSAAATAGSVPVRSSPAAATTAASPTPSPAANGNGNLAGNQTSGFQWAQGLPAYGSSADRASAATPPADNRTTNAPATGSQAAPNDPRAGSPHAGSPVAAPSLVSPGAFSPSSGGASSPSNPPAVLSVPSRPGPTSPAPPSGIAPPYSMGNGANVQPPLSSSQAAASGTLPQGSGGYTPPTPPAGMFPNSPFNQNNLSPNSSYSPSGGFSPQGVGGHFGATGAGFGPTSQPPATQPSATQPPATQPTMQPAQRGGTPGMGGVLRLDQDPPRYGWPSR